MDMRCEEKRLKTFINWPVTFLTPEILAKNGFYYLGYSDVVCCAYCKLEIMCWVEGDDPAVEHHRFSPLCPLLEKKVDLDKEIYPQKNQDNKKNNLLFPAVLNSNHFTMNTLANKPLPVNPKYASYQARLHTFADWPRSIFQKPEDLADAGFYYTGCGDKTKCFFCGGGLNQWERDDDPWKEHAIWFPNCFFINIFKDVKFKLALPPKQGTLETKTTTTESKQIAEVTKGLENTKIKDDSINSLCIICCVEKWDVAILPCGHVCACGKCLRTIDKCPTCRGSIDNFVRLYFA